MEPASRQTRMVMVRSAGALLGVLMLGAVAAASDSAFVGALFESPHWPRLDTRGTFLSIAKVAGLGVLVVFAFGRYLEPIGRVSLHRADEWLANGRYRAAVVLSALVILYVLVYCGLSFYRHYHFNSTGWDLAIQDQVVWNTSQGRLFESSIEVRNYFGDHVQPYLAIMGLFYVLIASPYVLLAVQTIVLGSCAWPLYVLGRRKFDSAAVGLTFAFCGLAYPVLGYINRYDFHVEVVVIPLILAALERIDAKKLRTASVFLALVLLAKEEMGLTVAVIGFMTALISRNWRFGVTWTVVGVAYSFSALFFIIPAFRGAPSDTLGFYGWLGGTPVEIVRTLIFEPGFVASNTVEPRRITTLLQLLAPLAFFPLFSLRSLVPIVPALMYNFLILVGYWSTIYDHHVSIFVPFMFVGAVMGLDRVTSDPRWKRASGWVLGDAATPRQGLGAGVVLMVSAVLASWLYQNPLLDDGKAFAPAKTVQSNHASIREGLTHVPDEAYVVTTNHYAPHLSHRRNLQIFMNETTLHPPVDAMFLNLRDLRMWATCEEYRGYVGLAFESGFGVTYHQDSVLVLEKGAGDVGELRRLIDTWRGCDQLVG